MSSTELTLALCSSLQVYNASMALLFHELGFGGVGGVCAGGVCAGGSGAVKTDIAYVLGDARVVAVV